MGNSSPLWSHTVGHKPYKVRVFERTPGGKLSYRTWDRERGCWRKKALGHRDKAAARAFAHELHAKLVRGEVQPDRKQTLSDVMARYLTNQTPTKSQHEQGADRRRAELWARFLGADMDPCSIRLSQWERFIRDRTTGAIDSRGHPVQPGRRRVVRPRTVEVDCSFLHAVFRWASRWRLHSGYLLPENPVRGFQKPREKNPRRPAATQERYEKTLATAKRLMLDAPSREVRAIHRDLHEMLVLVHETGRRLSSIRTLTYADLHLGRGPQGSIKFRAENDKMGLSQTVPMSPEARRSIDRILRERPGIGDAPLFPSPRDPARPIKRHSCDTWLREVEEEACLEPLKGALWHAYRRKFVTERRGEVPDVVIARLGGWKCTRTLDIYSQPSDAMLLEGLEKRRELRESME